MSSNGDRMHRILRSQACMAVRTASTAINRNGGSQALKVALKASESKSETYNKGESSR